MDDVDKLFNELTKQALIYPRSCQINIYDVPYIIDRKTNAYTKEEAIAAVLKWILDGQPRAR